ncbi:hypothetical protein C900_05462 [Fulvivirga imtechensis AK7]|uniref:Sensory/regulatory protein RpfC n=1 Tax=Fulvivirga imtechensis AK7 TaxID=1237149 RepID=L8JLE2_9BACT|nr:ATP-binding protein [Fulvivirga imtechensis]ELR69073.1 hypothetical protein C900_05462 [Fulvivirga imtechensis AK7]
MKGKIILTFVFALLALALIGFIGQMTLTQLIVSIKEESQPNQKLTVLKDILTDLSDAESSVRTYTITRESENLTPFYESITTIDNKMTRLYDLVKNREQLVMIDSMERLIEQKYGTLKELIDIKKDHDTEELFERVLENIAKLRQKDSIPEPIAYRSNRPSESIYDRIQKVEIPKPEREEKKLSIFQRIFGKNHDNDQSSTDDPTEDKPADLAEELSGEDLPHEHIQESQPDSALAKNASKTPILSNNDLSSRDIGRMITKIGQERTQNIKAVKEQELALTVRDNALMQKIQKVANEIEAKEKSISLSRAESAEKATDRAIDLITITLIAALVFFAVLLFIIFNDISRNQKNKEKLRKAKEKAEKLAKVKEEFLSNMSHEIRTPLNSIIGYTEQLEGTPLLQEQKKYLSSIHHSGNHLLRIINDILDYAKLESGKLSLESIGFSAGQNIDEVIESFENHFKKKHLEIRYEISDSVPEVVIGDPVRFKQILINLIGNSIKFTSKGAIEVKLEAKETDKDVARLALTVADTGIGIPPAKVNSIFNDFAQVDSSTTRKYGGTGLGLSIVKKIVEMHDGTISVESEEGKGTAFLIELSYKIGSKEDLKEVQKALPIQYDLLSGKKIMAVDDQEYNLELINVIFNKWKIDGTTFTSAHEAIKAFESEPYDLILMDVQMPEMSGLEATEKIRSIEKKAGKRIPVIALTAAASREEADQCLKAGMDGYVLKPFTQIELYSKLIEMLVPDHRTVLQHATAAPIEDKLNLDDLQKLSNGDAGFVINMLKIFLKNFDVDLSNIYQGLHTRNWYTLRLKSHKMIPPCRHLGLMSLVILLKEIEKESQDGKDLTKVEELLQRVSDTYNEVKPEIQTQITRLEKNLPKSVA